MCFLMNNPRISVYAHPGLCGAFTVLCYPFVLLLQPLLPLQACSEETLRRRRDEEVGPQRETQPLERLTPSLKPLGRRG